MAKTFQSMQLRNQYDLNTRFEQDQRNLAVVIGRHVQRLGVGSESILPNIRRTKERLKNEIWGQYLRPYFIGQGDNPIINNSPQSPFAQLVFDGVERSTRISVQQQIALLRRHVRDDVVFNWLTGSRPFLTVNEFDGLYDPFHQFVDPSGYTLSDRVWRAGIETRARIDRLLDYHISQGTNTIRIAELLEDFLTKGSSLIKTRTPYGKEGSYAARRLARTEVAAAAGRSTVNASIANPFVEGIRWRLSASHPCCDICDTHAKGGPNGDGVYSPESLPTFPAHPHDICSLLPVAVGKTADLVQTLRRDIATGINSVRRELQGMFNENWLVNAIMFGALDDILKRITNWGFS